MSVINDFLMGLSTDTRNAIWYGCIVLFFGTMAIASAAYEKVKKHHNRTAIKSALLTVLSFCTMLLIAYGIEVISNRLVFLSGVTYCIPVVVFCAYVLYKTQKRDLLESMDQVMLCYLMGRVIHIIGCNFVGCCQGVPAEWGIYSAVSKTTVVPVQAIECICLLIAWMGLNRYYRQNSYNTGGRSVALGLIAFGLINFVTDIFTITFPKIIFMTSLEGIFAFLTMCVGLIVLYLLDKKKAAVAAYPRNN